MNPTTEPALWGESALNVTGFQTAAHPAASGVPPLALITHRFPGPTQAEEAASPAWVCTAAGQGEGRGRGHVNHWACLCWAEGIWMGHGRVGTGLSYVPMSPVLGPISGPRRV